MQNSAIIESLQFPISVVAHDAGAANHIIAWLRNLDNLDVIDANQISICIAGPAHTLWLQEFPNATVGSLSDSLSNAKSLISGTGWQSTLEHDARKLAQQLGIKSIAVIDHWTNYRERFIRSEQEVLPDEIWVADKYAKNLAKSQFPNLRVVQLPNFYLDSLVQEVQSTSQQVTAKLKSTGINLLYVLEPIRQDWGFSKKSGEFQALDFFVKNLAVLELHDDLLIRLRPHPSDPIGKYDQWYLSIFLAGDKGRFFVIRCCISGSRQSTKSIHDCN